MAEFVHLHNHSDFSLLDGAASVPAMVAKAKAFGMPALALTDHGNMFGAVKFYDACKDAGIKPIVGAEFYVAGASRFERTGTENGNKYWHFILLARNEEGYRNLLKLSSSSYTEGFYYKPRIDFELLSRHAGGLIGSSACIAGEIPSLIIMGKEAEAERVAMRYSELFGSGHFYLELQDHGIAEQKTANKGLVAMARRTGLPLISTNDMHYLERSDAEAHDVMLCIGTNRKRDEPNRMRFHGPEFYMKSPEEMTALFAEIPEAAANTLRIAEMVDLKIAYPGPMLPDYDFPPEYASPEDYMRSLTFEGLKRRYPVITEEIRQRADYELGVVISMKFTGYFLIVWDFIHWAKEHGIPVGPGRGSGAGSIVAYALRITDIDPLKYNLLFERFLNPERISMPDFDIDFCYERRGEVIDYVTAKYGSDRTGQIITFGTLKAKAVLKDVARALDIPYEDANNLAKLVPEDPKMTLAKALEGEPKLRALSEELRYKDLFEVARKLEHKNRHASLHAAGIVIGKTALTDFVPLFKDPKTGIVATQYTMDYLEKCGLVKMDFLGLKTLTLIKHSIDLVRRRGIEIEEDRIPEDDTKTFELLGEGKSTSVFQFESSGMQAILKQAKPSCMEDLIALNALYRPGPMAYIPQFIDSKWGREPITYPDPCLEPILKETYGVIVYQEQVMQVAQRIGGYSLGQADLLRRAMGKKKHEVMVKEKEKFVASAVKNGFKEADADRIFEILIPFAGYGFNKSHAAAYSVVAYRTAYLKANFPPEFMAANLTNEIANTDKLTEYIGEARSMGIELMPPDVNRSESNFSVSEEKIVYGLLGIKGVGEGLAKAIVEEREKRGKFASFIEFVERMGSQVMNKKSLECLAHAGCFDALGNTRRELVLDIERAVEYAQAKEAAGRYGQVSLFDGSGEEEYPPFCVNRAEEYPRSEILRIEKELLGFYFSGHPMDEWKKIWERCADADLAHLERASPDKTYTVIAMLKEFREIFTKAGKKMAFGALEDPNGSIEIVLFADALERWRDKFVVDAVLCLKGKIDLTRGKPSLKVDEFIDPSTLKEKSWKEVHLRLGSLPAHEEELYALRDALFDEPGPCNVYFHLPACGGGMVRGAGEGGSAAEEGGVLGDAAGLVEEAGEGAADARARGPASTSGQGAAATTAGAVVKAHVQITCSASEEALERLRAVSPVVEAWRD